MRIHKRLMKLKFVQELLAWAASLYIRLLRVSVRWDVVQNPKSAALMAAGGPVIGCFWHGSMLSMMPLQPRGRGLHVLISGHRDGLFISRCIKHLGIKTVSGSSRRGGSLALRRMAQLLSKGDIVLITPDGPRGPRMRAKAGAIKAAQLSAAPIIPLGAAATRARTATRRYAKRQLTWGRNQMFHWQVLAGHNAAENLAIATELTENAG